MIVAQLVNNEETNRIDFDGVGLHCGECFEVLIWNQATNSAEWVETRIECSDKWFLVGLSGIQVNGLFARRN